MTKHLFKTHSKAMGSVHQHQIERLEREESKKHTGIQRRRDREHKTMFYAYTVNLGLSHSNDEG